jgi:O-antigen/teichoic acid export membrane protein
MVGTILAFTLMLIFLFRPQINAYVGFNAWLFVAGLVVSKKLFNIVTLQISADNRVATASIIRFTERALRPLLQVGLVVLGMGVAGMLSGYIAASVVGCLLAVFFLPGELARPSTEHFVRLFSFAKFSILKIFRPRAARWTDTAVLGFFVSANLVGVYEIAWSLALLLILATDSLNRSLFPTLSELGSDDRIRRVTNMTESALMFTGVVVIPGFVGSILLGEDLLALFGPEFTRGVVVLPILVTWSLIVSYERVLQNTIDALDRPDLTFRANLVYIVVNILGNVTLVYYYGWIGAAVATSGSAALSLVATWWYSRNLFDPDYPFGEVTKQVLAAWAMAVVVYPVSLITTNFPRAYVLVPVAVGAGIYFIVLILLSTRVRNQVLGVL